MNRFWSKVRVGAPDECWPWTAAHTLEGYGKFWSGGLFLAHRLSLEMSGVDVPADRLVLHSCDNPPCVNPAHLRVGDRRANMRDAIERGQAAIGERHGMHRLTEIDVVNIRELRASGERLRDIGQTYGISDSQVSVIARGLAWSMVSGPRVAKDLTGGHQATTGIGRP